MANAALQKAIDAMGGQSALARALGLPQQNIWWWLNKMDRVPAEQAVPIERATNGAVTRRELRPDLYPPEPVAPASPKPRKGAPGAAAKAA